jgi:hypothetical protein
MELTRGCVVWIDGYYDDGSLCAHPNAQIFPPSVHGRKGVSMIAPLSSLGSCETHVVWIDKLASCILDAGPSNQSPVHLDDHFRNGMI